MKVMQINTVCGRGSTGRIATDLLTCLRMNGHSGRIAYGVGAMMAAQQEDTIKIDTEFEYYVHNVMSRFTDLEGRFSTFATKRLIRKIKMYKPDVIHLHNLHGHYINYRQLFSYLKKAETPVVWTFHDCWPFTGHCTYFSLQNCNQWKVQCARCGQLHSYPTCYTKGNVRGNFIQKRDSFTGLENLVIVTPSKWMAGLVKESFLKEYPVKVINNGINLDKFSPGEMRNFRKKYGLEEKVVILAVSSDWSARKGYGDYIKLSEKLPENHKIVMVGLNEQQIKELPKSILAIGRTNSVEELAEIYSSADVLFNFTYEDNFPTVNLEAMACGTPVVTYNTGGSVEVITEKNGRVVEQGDYVGALRVLKDVRLLDRQDIAQYATKFRAEDRYSEYINLYEECMRLSKKHRLHYKLK